MSKMSKFLIATAFCAVALPSVAMADVIGSGTGSFNNLSGCGGEPCSISSTGGGSSNKVSWGTSTGSGQSTLTATTVNFDVSANGTYEIAELDWLNTPIQGDNSLSEFNVDYTLKINIQGGTGDQQVFTLNIYNTVNSTGDAIATFINNTLNSDITLGDSGWTIGNLKYGVLDSSSTLGSCPGDDHTTISNGWCNPENNLGKLAINATFTQTAVPEPLTLSLFGAGLAGAAAIRRRKAKA